MQLHFQDVFSSICLPYLTPRFCVLRINNYSGYWVIPSYGSTPTIAEFYLQNWSTLAERSARCCSVVCIVYIKGIKWTHDEDVSVHLPTCLNSVTVQHISLSFSLLCLKLYRQIRFWCLTILHNSYVIRNFGLYSLLKTPHCRKFGTWYKI
jgi:hypothetical protein